MTVVLRAVEGNADLAFALQITAMNSTDAILQWKKAQWCDHIIACLIQALGVEVHVHRYAPTEVSLPSPMFEGCSLQAFGLEGCSLKSLPLAVAGFEGFSLEAPVCLVAAGCFIAHEICYCIS